MKVGVGHPIKPRTTVFDHPIFHITTQFHCASYLDSCFADYVRNHM
jgi:hypothetical protein